jgi:hypothetical protein
METSNTDRLDIQIARYEISMLLLLLMIMVVVVVMVMMMMINDAVSTTGFT